jgi:hypothetical protein
LSLLPCVISAVGIDYRVTDELRAFLLEKLVELGSLGFVLNGSVQHERLGELDRPIFKLLLPGLKSL